jgi:hypothetical protein
MRVIETTTRCHRSMKVYELFAQPGGGFSNRAADHEGTIFAVAADSSEQAHELAANDAWAAGPDDPVGILWVYRRGEPRDHQLFNGYRVWGNDVHEVHHGAGKTAIVTWMRGVLRRSSRARTP